MKTSLFPLIILSLFLFASCKSENKESNAVKEIQLETPINNDIHTTDELEDIVTLYVASTKADCVGVAPMKCLQVKDSEDGEWQFMYTNIEGFHYEEGYEYKIEVRRETVANPPADGSSIRYILVKEISKEKK